MIFKQIELYYQRTVAWFSNRSKTRRGDIDIKNCTKELCPFYSELYHYCYHFRGISHIGEKGCIK